MKKDVRDFIDFLEDIVDAMEKAMNFVEGMSYEEFAQDDKTIFAVIRALEITGEAVKSVPDEIRKNYPEIPWRGMAGMRDKVVHEYFGVNLKIVWETVNERVPEIRPLFEKMLRDIKTLK